MRIPTICIVCLGFLFVTELHAENWPCWRGPMHNGNSNETQVPTQWNATENVKWKTAIPGVGHSSPIVWGDAIFLTTCELENRTRRLLRVDRESGAVVWSNIIAEASIEEMHRDNTPASATPTTDGQHVFVVFCVESELLVSAVDLDGEISWSRSVDSFEASHGFCSSLVLDGNSLFLSGLQDGASAFVAALEKSTGEILWKVPRTKQIRSYSTPFLCEIGDTKAILLSGADQTIAYNRHTGETLWEMAGPGSKTVSSIVACDQCKTAFICGGRDNKFIAVDLRRTVEASTPQISWTETKAIPYMTSPLLFDGRLHILSDEGVYRCYEASSGRVLNERRAVGAVKASMIANANYIFVTEVSGRTTVIKNDESWSVVSQNQLDEEVVASPALSNGDLIIRGRNHLFLIRQGATG
ncbi:MAG: PQQ-binding-like beta-propeller repeat protein [Planctomycetales bacterium]|nr:PQQ-binding-like beta-propeller repeat protein [Planctomycetales bacterium]